MRLRKLLGGLGTAIFLLTTLFFASPQAGAQDGTSRSFTGTDPSNDAEFSSLCQFDDREPDPYFGIPATGVQAANCDNKVPVMDFTTYGLEYIPAGGTGALLDPSGNDGLWGTTDDGQGPDGKPGTGDEPGLGTNPAITRTVGTIKATWTFADAWPAANLATPLRAAGSKNEEVISGMSAFTAFRNADIQNNTLQAACDRSAPAMAKWNGLSPTVTQDGKVPPTGTTPAYIYDPRGALHYEDATYFHVWVSWEYKGVPASVTRPNDPDQQPWRPKINFGYYDPTIDSDIHYSESPQLNPLYNPWNPTPTPQNATAINPWTGLGKFYSWDFSNGNKTLTVKYPAVYVDVDSGCMDQGAGNNQEPYAYWPYARSAAVKTGVLAPRSLRTGNILNPGNGQNDVLFDIFARTMVSVRPTLPVPIPLGSVVGAAICPTQDSLPTVITPPVAGPVPPKCNNALRSDIDWIIGLGFDADNLQLPDGTNAFQGGWLSPVLGPSVMPGATCSSPTYGGNLPKSPLHNPGEPCALRNPYNIGLKANPNHINVY